MSLVVENNRQDNHVMMEIPDVVNGNNDEPLRTMSMMDSLEIHTKSAIPSVKCDIAGISKTMANMNMDKEGTENAPHAVDVEDVTGEKKKTKTDLASLSGREFYLTGGGGGGGDPQSHDDVALQKKLIEAITANEIFSDPGMDFLANAGSKSGVHDSELARMSLYQHFDPFVGKATAAPAGLNSNKTRTASTMGPPAVPMMPPPSVNPQITFRQNYATPSHTATTDMIALMQQKQNAILRQQQQQASQRTTPLSNGSGDGRQTGVNGEAPPLQRPNFDETISDDSQSTAPPPGSIVNFGLTDGSPQRPVTLRTKVNGSGSANKQLYRRSVPVGFLDGPEGLLGATMMSPLESHEEFSGYPELNPMWENVLATYEGLLRVTLNKMSALQSEASEAKQREAKAVKDQEEMHRVFVALHERFDTSKNVIATYRQNQETLQKAFDDLNAEFQPALQETKKMQATVRMNEIKMRKMEHDLEKKNEEIAELTRIVDDLINTKDS